ncbi:sialin [Dendroctonus ponderosae]|uniref:sialin n=1 Tax=Dendroctonus ponderosae TaxID=77166 RepID=UPI0020365ABA|nr:sialin [Dendroctonus ponderosae]
MSISLPAMVMPGKKFIAECKKGEHTSNSTQTKPEDDTGTKYPWDQKTQGFILGAYFYGYLMGSLPGGAVAEWLGPYWTIMTATMFSAILNSICVWVLVNSFINLRRLGSRLSSSAVSYRPLGAASRENEVCSLFNGKYAWNLFNLGYWWCGFHVMSLQNIAFCVIFGLLTFDSPEQHKWITDEELEFIKKSQEGKVSKTKALPPYKSILTSFPFWTLCVLHFGNLWGLYVQITAVPKFMKEYVGFDIKNSGVLSSLPHLIRLFMGLGYGFLGDYLKKRNFKRIIILKCFIILSHIVPGILMGLLSIAECNAPVVVALLTLSMAINGAAVVTNLANPTDLSPNFAGTIFGIISFIGGVTGFIVPSITGQIITAFGNNGKAWGSIFALGGLVYCGCGIFFIIFGTADTQPWNEKKEEKADTSQPERT